MNHVKIRGSQLFRVALCPGSARMEKDAPDEESSDAIKGRLLHDYDAHPEYDRSFLAPKDRDLLELNEGLRARIVERISNLGIQSSKPILIRELRYETEMISGTPDLTMVFESDGIALVNDSKFGFKIVPSADLNLQLRAYAILVLDRIYPKAQQIYVSITQPRLSYDQRTTMAVYSLNDISEARKEIRRIVEAAQDPDAKLNAGELQCRYCKAKMICPAFKEKFSQLYPFNPKLDLSVALRTDLVEKRLSLLTDDLLDQILIACSLAKMVSGPANEEVRRRKVIDPDRLPQLTIGKDYEVREIKDVQKAIALLELADIQTRSESLDIASLPIGAIEDHFRIKTGAAAKDAREKINRVLSSVIGTKSMQGRISRK